MKKKRKKKKTTSGGKQSFSKKGISEKEKFAILIQKYADRPVRLKLSEKQ